MTLDVFDFNLLSILDLVSKVLQEFALWELDLLHVILSMVVLHRVSLHVAFSSSTHS